MKYFNTFSIAALFTCLSVMQSDATILNVQVEDNQFNLGNFSINTGDTIIWIWDNSAGAHTTTSTSIPVTATTWDDPINQGSPTFLYISAFAGSYDYQCNFHVTSGMTGHFTVIGNNRTPFFSGMHAAGTFTEEFESGTLSKGVYVINLETPEGNISRKVILQ